MGSTVFGALTSHVSQRSIEFIPNFHIRLMDIGRVICSTRAV
jgi:hypothetical protein